jgi:plasmid stabilization system protein ParE
MTRYFAEAEAKLNEAAQFYENRQPGLGADFLQTIGKALDSIEQHPRRWPLFSGPVRRCLVSRFPYGIVYVDYHGEIIVVAIAHLSRHPTYRLSRLPDVSMN